MLGRALVVFLRCRRRVSDEGGGAGIARENAGAVSSNLSCVHILMEVSSGKVPLQIQAPDHFKVRLINWGSSEIKIIPLSENQWLRA